MTFRNDYEFKKRLVEPGLVWSRTLLILLSMNVKSVSMSIMGRHFEQVYCRQLKNGQLNEMSDKVSEM